MARTATGAAVGTSSLVSNRVLCPPCAHHSFVPGIGGNRARILWFAASHKPRAKGHELLWLSVGIRRVGADDADAMIGERCMHAGQ